MNRPNKKSEEKLNLKLIRKILGLTQEELAEAIGVSVRTISRCETGETEPVFTVAQMKRFNRVIRQAGHELDDLPDVLSNSGKTKRIEEPIAA